MIQKTAITCRMKIIIFALYLQRASSAYEASCEKDDFLNDGMPFFFSSVEITLGFTTFASSGKKLEICRPRGKNIHSILKREINPFAAVRAVGLSRNKLCVASA